MENDPADQFKLSERYSSKQNGGYLEGAQEPYKSKPQRACSRGLVSSAIIHPYKEPFLYYFPLFSFHIICLLVFKFHSA